MPDYLSISNIVVEGDSNSDLDYGTWNNWCEQLGAKLANLGYTEVMGSNFANAGDTWADLTTRGATVDGAVVGDFNVLILASGTNDLRNTVDDDTGEEALAEAQSYINSRVSAGVWDRIVMLTIPPLSGNSADNDEVNIYNSGLESLNGVDFIIDRRLDSELSNSNNDTYFFDNLHYNETGHDILSDRALTTLIANLVSLDDIVGIRGDGTQTSNSILCFGGMM